MADVEMSSSKPRSSALSSWMEMRTTLIVDLRYGQNKGRPSTVIPRAVRPANKKGIKT